MSLDGVLCRQEHFRAKNSFLTKNSTKNSLQKFVRKS